MSWKVKTMLIYGLGGLILGILAGMITVNKAVDEEKEPEFSVKKGAKVGLAVIDALKKTII